MVYSGLYEDFLKDKQVFFSLEQSTERAKALAKNKEYSFLANNQLSIEQEFNQLFASLKKNGYDRKEFWLYCLYCCTMLETYYEAYDKQDKAADYRKWAQQLQVCCDTGVFPKEKISSLQETISKDFASLLSVLTHTSKIRDWLGFINIYRIDFVFCRLFVKQSLLFLRERQWLDKFDQLLGLHTDVDGMVAMINSPAAVFNVLSIGLFLARLIISAGTLLKHTFSVSDKENISTNESKLSKTDRFYQELYARHCVMLNDIVWATVNLFSNYAAFFNISATTAGWLTAGFLVFDVLLLVWRRHLAEKEYEFKKGQYIAEKANDYDLLLKNSITPDAYRRHNGMLNAQLAQLEIKWQATSDTYLFNVAAAGLLMMGFSASMIFVMPAAVVVSYLVCTVAVTMYLTADTFGKYREKSLSLELLDFNEIERALALLEMQSARSDFILAMTKSIITPLLIVTVFAVCWEAALLLTIVYVGYECTRGYFNHPSPAEDAAQELPPSIEPKGGKDAMDDHPILFSGLSCA